MVCDYDNDGKRDLLVGDGDYGYVYFYHNTGTDANPRLKAGVRLLVGINPLTVSPRATPCVYDWDGDGLNDLLCGNGDGYVLFLQEHRHGAISGLCGWHEDPSGGNGLESRIRSVVRMFDRDGDGVTDLVGSSDTGVYWCRNIGSAVPVLAIPVALRAPVAGSGLRPIYTGPRMRLDLVDWNNDGVMDLLLGNLDGTISYYEGYRFRFTAVAAQPAGACALEWQSAAYLNYRVLAGPSTSAITNLVATNLPSGGKTTCWTNSTQADRGFYRLQIAP